MRIPFDEVAEIVKTWPKLTGYNIEIAEHFGVTRRTAERWVYLTRLKGLLPSGSEPVECPRCKGAGTIQRMTGATTRR